MSNQTADAANVSKSNNNLPQFMNENSKVNYTDIEENTSWLTNNLHRLMIWVSAAWFAVVLIYITQFFGWSNLFLMMPDEFGGFFLWPLSGWLWPILTAAHLLSRRPNSSAPI